MNISKKYKYILPAIALLVMVGCMDLNENPMTFITPDQFFKTEDDANAICLSMYQDMYKLSETVLLTTRGVQGNIADSRFTSFNVLEPRAEESNHMTNTWFTLYRCIMKANTAIESLETSPLDKTKKNPYLGEAKAMRAFMYLRLVKNWGDVPLHTTSLDNNYGVVPMKQIYDQIFKDLNEALYVTEIQKSLTKPGRLDKGACRMILADAAITIAQSAKSYKSGNPDAAALKPYADVYGDQINDLFNLAHTHLDTLINKEGFKLTDGINMKWINMFGRTAAGADNVNAPDNKEVIVGTMTIPNEYASLKELCAPGPSEYYPAQWNFPYIMPTYEYVASFDKDDIRRNEGFIWNYQLLGLDNIIVRYWYIPFRKFGNEPYDGLEDLVYKSNPAYADYPNASAGEQWGGADAENKYRFFLENDVYYFIMASRNPNCPTPPCKKFYDASCLSGDPAISVPLYRLAEAYLMFAEAEAALNGVSQMAVDHLNVIHVRSFPEVLRNNHTFQTSDFENLEDFNKHIINEYLWEFGFENKDANVLIRFGKLQERIAKIVDTYNPIFSPYYTGPALGVEAEWQGQYASKTRKTRGLDQYWLPYPHSGEETNPAIMGLIRMNYK
ncbi:MAG: RagB/SusD family nutrient uptake outer membrane protein [Dysgonamonadaceae bacterium]|jgi:hypothetical protein|nr:RagB/SusD family nutrient uptake outer membrane protein [Dysgonamonadaceae bacterium]